MKEYLTGFGKTAFKTSSCFFSIVSVETEGASMVANWTFWAKALAKKDSKMVRQTSFLTDWI